MKEKIILITHEYPCGNGENFIQEELRMLCGSFRQVEIITTKPTLVRRDVPKNCLVSEYNVANSLIENLKLLFLLIWNLPFLIDKIVKEVRAIQKIYKKKITWTIVKKMLHDIAKGFQIYNYLRVHPDADKSIFYSYWFDNKALALAILKEKMGGGVVVVSRIHGWELYFERHKDNYISFQRYKAQTLSCVFFIADQGLRYFIEKTGMVLDSLWVSKLGTKQPLIKNQEQQERYTIVSCSNIVDIKRVHLIIEALSRFETLPIKWYHFGTGPLEVEIKDLAFKLLSEKGNVEYQFLGQLTNDEVHCFYAQNKIDLFLNVSIFEGLPVSLMEAISYGIPIMATAVGGSAEICNNETGILLQKDISASELAEALKMFFGLPEEKKMGNRKSAFAYWAVHFSAETNYRRFVEKLNSL